jgi:hypothetical protein
MSDGWQLLPSSLLGSYLVCKQQACALQEDGGLEGKLRWQNAALWASPQQPKD